jgi:hypothetical protein
MAAMKNVIYLHGFASSSNNSKGLTLLGKSKEIAEIKFRSFDFNPTPADFSNMTVTGMISRLRQFILDHALTDCFLVGSSLGALVALHYTKYFDNIKQLLLLAPALRFSIRSGADSGETKNQKSNPVFHYGFNMEIPLFSTFYQDGQGYRELVKPSVPTVIIHGKQDEVIPIDESRSYASSYPELVTLIEVDSNHRLGDQIEMIWQQILQFE